MYPEAGAQGVWYLMQKYLMASNYPVQAMPWEVSLMPLSFRLLCFRLFLT